MKFESVDDIMKVLGNIYKFPDFENKHKIKKNRYGQLIFKSSSRWGDFEIELNTIYKCELVSSAKEEWDLKPNPIFK